MDKLSKKEKSRLRIMHAAKGLFEKQGLDNVTFSQIAEAADVCRTTVFNHFSGTRDLMLAISVQEIRDIIQYCHENEYKGKDLICALFDKLIEDTAYYPMLTSQLINNAVLTCEGDNPVKVIERMTADGLRQEGITGEDEIREFVIIIEGAYFGLINHYHINNRTFDSAVMKEQFHKLLDKII